MPSIDSGGAGLDLGPATEGEDRSHLLGNGAPPAGRSATPHGRQEVNIAIVPPSTPSARGNNLGEFGIPMISVSREPSPNILYLLL